MTNHFVKQNANLSETKELTLRLNTENPREFWSALKNLGPRKTNNIPMQIYNDEGNIIVEIDEVMAKWKFDFNTLFQGYDTNEFNPQFYNYILNEKE